MRRRAVGVTVAGLVAIGAACAGAPGVHTEEAAPIETTPPPATTDPATTDSTTTEDTTSDAPAWRSCPGTADLALSFEWECRWIEVPLDHADPEGRR
jgi:hypothetical protein